MDTEKIMLGYVRVSTNEQVESGAGLEAQRERLRQEATRQGMRLVLVEEKGGVSGSSMRSRHALVEAMDQLDKGKAHALAVTKCDRLARHTADFCRILERSRRNRWQLIILDLNLDTRTAMGEAMATMSAVFAQLEAKRIGERTREALAVKKSQGVRLGAPRVEGREGLRHRIIQERKDGSSYGAIARELNADRIAPLKGVAWYPSTVRSICQGEGVA
jgi:DNA invertase Pin-like site-specific DNA recombinase